MAAAGGAGGKHSHRAGKLKQQNKKNKRSSASKRSKNRLQGGKIQSLPSGQRRRGVKSNDTGISKAKANRVNAARQRRDASRKNAWNARRGVGGAMMAGSNAAAALSSFSSRAPPRIVGIISLSESENRLEERVRLGIAGAADATVGVTSAFDLHAKGGVPHLMLLANSVAFRSQYTSSSSGVGGGGYGEEDASVQAALDLCRVCDVALFLIDGSAASAAVVDAATVDATGDGGDARSLAGASVKTSNTTAHLDHLISERGDRILSAIKAQGLPTPVTVVVHEGGGGGNGNDGVPKGVGGTGGDAVDDDDAMDNDDDEDMEDEEEDDAFEIATVGRSVGELTHRSAKSIRRSRLRRRAELKRYASRLATTEFGAEAGGRVLELDLAGDDDNFTAGDANTHATDATAAGSRSSVAALVRTLCTSSASPPSWVSDVPRPYLVATDDAPARYDESRKELTLVGYVRGATHLDANRAVHVPHLGTFSVKDVRLDGVAGAGGGTSVPMLLPPIVAAGRKRRKKAAADGNIEMGNDDDDAGGATLLAESDPEARERLEMFATPDVLEGEQNLIGFDEDNFGDDDMEDDNVAGVDDRKKTERPFEPGTSRPAGWSDYQSAWLDALGEEGEDGDDRGELAFALNKKTVPSVKDGMNDDDDEVNAEEKRALAAARKKDRRDDLQFPDEVDHEEETSARDRFARYRAIKSFRKSHWDPKENLPGPYGAVYHFGSFRATQRDVLEDARDVEEIVMRRGWGVNVGEGAGEGNDAEMERDSDDEEEEAVARACVPPGAYVALTLEGVSPSAYASLSPDAMKCAVSLLSHETKASVLHMGLSSSQSQPQLDGEGRSPVKSKDVLTFRCGWRTWTSRPVFSQNNLNSDKHKFERYMPSGGAFFAGSAYGPTTFGNCPALVFRERKGTTIGGGEEANDAGRELVAHGSILGADADRIVLKRIVLTGYPTRVHKRHATVKYMFYNPEDVRWFMPAGITTKHGLQGNIIQSVGDHGVMKCLFNAPIKQHDTVCLSLYKRVFPKFAPVGGDEEGGEEGDGSGKHFRVL